MTDDEDMDGLSMSELVDCLTVCCGNDAHLAKCFVADLSVILTYCDPRVLQTILICVGRVLADTRNGRVPLIAGQLENGVEYVSVWSDADLSTRAFVSASAAWCRNHDKESSN